MNGNEVQAVRVHVVADSTQQPQGPRRHAARYRTIVLSAAQPIAVVCGVEPLRERITLLNSGATNGVWVTDSEQAALAVVAAGTGGGSDTAGLLPAGVSVKYSSTEVAWCAATAYPASLTVIITSRES